MADGPLQKGKFHQGTSAFPGLIRLANREGAAERIFQMTHPPYLLGLDLGGTSVKAVAVTPEGERLAKFHTTFDLAESMAFAKAVGTAAARATAQLGRPQRIGVSAPGIAAQDGRNIA